MEAQTTERTAGKKRPKSRVLRLIPWIFSALLAVGMLWVFTNIDGPEESVSGLIVDTLQAPNLAGDDSVVTEPEVRADSRVAEFVEFAQRNRVAREGPEHVYTGEGIQRLSVSIEAIARRYGSDQKELAPKLARLRTYGWNIERRAASASSADTVHQAFELATDLMADLQKRSFPQVAPQVSAMQRTTDLLAPNRPLPAQVVVVDTYFRQASEALQIMVKPAS